MKTIVTFLTIVVLGATLSLSANAQANNENWNKSHVNTTVKHIQKYGEADPEGKIPGKGMLLPNGDMLMLVIGTRDTVITFIDKSEGEAVQVFTGEPKSFKGNTINMFPMIAGAEKYTSQCSRFAAMLEDVANNRPLPPPGLFEGKDELTRKLQAFIKRINPTNEFMECKYNHETNENVCVSQSYSGPRIRYTKGSQDYVFQFDSNMPLTAGVDENGQPINLDLLAQVFNFKESQ